MTPVGAHGGNCAIESVAALANSLERHLHQRSGQGVNNETIQAIFQTYQKTREARVRKIAGTVYSMTRLATWDDHIKKFVGRYVLPWLNDVTLVSRLVKEAVRVDFLPIPSRAKGFSDQIDKEEQAMRKNAEKLPRWRVVMYAIMGTIACTMLLTSKRLGKNARDRQSGLTFQST